MTIIVAAGLLLLFGGLHQSRSFPTIAPGVMLGAIVLTMMAVSDNTAGFSSIYFQITLDGGAERNVAFAGVTAIGAALLLGYGYNEWDRPKVETADEEDEG